MKYTDSKQVLSILKKLAFFGVLLITYFFLFYKSMFICPKNYMGNLNEHMKLADRWATGEYFLPHPGFHALSIGVSKLTGRTLQESGIVVHTLFTVLTIFIVYKILASYLKNKYSENFILLMTACVSLVIAIYVPSFSMNMYLGQGNPNMITSVTLTALKPFMLLCIIFYLAMIKAVDSKSGEVMKYGGLLAAALMVSVLMKPSFALVFIPAVAIQLVLTHTRNIKLYTCMAVIILPALAVLIWQSYNMFIAPEVGYKSAIEIKPFYIWNTVTRNIFISILLATAFPLIITLLNPKKAFKNNGLVISWIMALIGIAQYAFLVETTSPFAYNWMWGYSLSLLPLFVFSLIEFLSSIDDMWHNGIIVRTGVVAAGVIFLLHLASGVGYFIKLMNCGSFI
ncbi:MAG: hypothetical protein WC359_12170 [Dehalococcoidia bacterium]|jgi:hypothetical protein